ncbi:hypothetical protein [Marinobacter lutaoensis]|uniref:hypothetical protein n=1 Tax=Marinobacter lutaoensis TaxID=135739 RepID=UPI0015949A8A|nr:hypothetical protein [Marinobacter lutaoensis]NVD37015.1 hypothetical protein [Marinobacter lutaoensis]
MAALSLRANDRFFIIAASAAIILVLYFFSLDAASNTFNAIAVGILAATSFFILKSRGGWVFLLYCFGLTFALVSGALIEATGVFLIEIRETAQLTGAAARNALLASFFLVMTYASYKLFLRIIPARLPRFQIAEGLVTRLLLTTAFLAPLYIACVLIIFGSPLFMGMDRFNYFTHIAPPGYTWVYGNIPMLGFVVALSAYKGSIRYRTSVVWLVAVIITYIFAGEKFSGIFLLLFFFLLPHFIISAPVVKTKHILIGAVLILALALVVFINYTLVYGSAEIFMARLALQGQMNYVIDMISGSARSIEEIVRNFLGLNVEDRERGIVYFMNLVAPGSLVDQMTEYGATFTAPFSANIVYFLVMRWPRLLFLFFLVCWD